MKTITFTPTGEVRPPKKGDWYKTEDGEFWKSDHDYVSPLFKNEIYTMTETASDTPNKLAKGKK